MADLQTLTKEAAKMETKRRASNPKAPAAASFYCHLYLPALCSSACNSPPDSSSGATTTRKPTGAFEAGRGRLRRATHSERLTGLPVWPPLERWW